MKKIRETWKTFWGGRSSDNLFRLDGAVPIYRAIPFGLQHVLSMFISNILPILLLFLVVSASRTVDPKVISNGIRSAIFFAALGTTIQLYPLGPVGSRLPAFTGVSFTYLGVLSVIGAQYGLSTMFLAVIIGGGVMGILGLFAKYWVRFIRPIVSATVVFALGLSLFLVGTKAFISYDVPGIVMDGVYQFDVAWPYLIVAFLSLITCLVWQVLVKGVWKNLSILAGLIVGYIAALCFTPYNGMVQFASLEIKAVTDVVDVPRPIFTLLPFSWGDFNIGAILTVILFYLISGAECIGSITYLTSTGLDREASHKELSGSMSAIGFASSLAGCFGGMPIAVYSQNVGIVGQTKVVNRFALFSGAVILFFLSFFPILSNFLLTIPDCVLGGCTMMLFASIAIVGMQMISQNGWTRKNITIVAISLGLGYGITLIPEFTAGTYDLDFVNYLMLIFKNPVANMFVISLILSYALPESLNQE